MNKKIYRPPVNKEQEDKKIQRKLDKNAILRHVSNSVSFKKIQSVQSKSKAELAVRLAN